VKSWRVILASAISLLLACTAAVPARADQLAFQRVTGQLIADANATLQALRDDFALAPSEAERLGAGIAAALSDGTAVRAVTFSLILVIIGAGLEWLYWTFAAAPLRAIVSTIAATPREAVVLALRRLGLLGFGLLLFTSSTLGAAMTLPWPPNVDVIVIAATALVVAVRAGWIIADVIVSPHHPRCGSPPFRTTNPALSSRAWRGSPRWRPQRSFSRSCSPQSVPHCILPERSASASAVSSRSACSLLL
jgi:hypothetical protein